MPENPYFRQELVQQRMTDVLFVYCKMNQDISYRQGMHELVAPILWVIDADAIGSANGAVEDDNLMLQMFDPAFVEHDTFSLFQALMRSTKASYELGDNASLFSLGKKTYSSPIVERSKIIHEKYLMAVDPELSCHLKDL